MSLNCGCNNRMLSDEAGVQALKDLYAKKGAGEVTFTERLTNNLPVAGVGVALGAGLMFAFNSFSKKGKK